MEKSDLEKCEKKLSEVHLEFIKVILQRNELAMIVLAKGLAPKWLQELNKINENIGQEASDEKIQ